MTDRLQALHDWAYHNLIATILPFWTADLLMDPVYGGFHGKVTRDMKVDPAAPRGLTLNGRMLYAFSEAYRVLGDPLYRRRADYAFEYLLENFHDAQYGGAFTTIRADGTVLEDHKPAYCEAFWIMACAAYYHATGNGKALSLARETVSLMEQKCKWAPSCYHNNMTRDWVPAEGMGFGGKGKQAMIFPEGAVMFPHHLCQAYVQLYRAAPDETVSRALHEMLSFILERLYDPGNRCFKSILMADGSRASSHQSFGHDCEISYLALDVADLVGTEKQNHIMKSLVHQVLEQALRHDFDAYGSLYNGCDLIDNQREISHVWWAQAEAVTAMLCSFELTGEEAYLTACEKQAEFIERFFVDREHGDWYNNIVVDGTGWHVVDGMHGFDKLNSGKCPFHNSQMCFEVMRRTQRLMKGVLE